MNLFGNSRFGDTAFPIPPDRKWVTQMRFPADPVSLIKVSAYMDGRAGGSFEQSARAVIYDVVDNLLAQSGEVVIPVGMPPQWIDFPVLVAGGLPVDGRNQVAQVGIHAGPADSTLTVYGFDPAPGLISKFGTDGYADGASLGFGAASPVSNDLSVFVTYINTFVPSSTSDLAVYAALPFHEAQAVLTSAATAQRYSARCGWHDQVFDAANGSFAIVRSDGPLASLVGQRIRISGQVGADQRTVVAYVHRAAGVVDDISIPLRLFVMLADTPGLTNVDATIAVLG